MMSMTGFGRAEAESSEYDLSVEIKTVNSKKSDIIFKIPPCLNPIEALLRKRVKERLVRGRIEVHIEFTDLSEESIDVTLNTELLKKYLSALDEIGSLCGDSTITIDTVLSLPDIITVSQSNYDEKKLEKIVLPTFGRALDEVLLSRQAEGENLKEDILHHAKITENLINKLGEKAPEAIEMSRAQLKKRLEEILGDVPLDESRFLTEVAVLSDRLAIDEEIARLKSHIALFIDTAESDGPVGKKLDFTLQELNREANTIASKSDNIEIIALSVDLKTEIEKMREQVQNIE